ncbi:MFS transporter [Rhodocyclus purpureus]|uniref:MFS transporter n=1 Tax=Rhodocyclus purpureus TaxID=1067 RepID=UPI00191148C2
MNPSSLRLFLLGDGTRASPALAWLIGFFAFLNVYSMQAVLPLVVDDFNASPVQAGTAVGATVLAIALVSPFMGMLSDAIGRKLVICVSLFALTLPTALIPLADSLHTLTLLRFLQGLAVPGIVVVFLAYIAEEFPGVSVTRTVATYVGGTVMGGFAGRFITGYAGDWFGWRGAFVALTLLNLAGALLVLWRLPRSRSFVPRRDVRAALRTLGGHLSNRRLLAACAVGFCVLFALVGSFTYVNLHLAGEPFNLSSSGLANVFCVYLVGVLVTPMAGKLVVRWGFRKALLVALTVSAGGLLLTLPPWLPTILLGLTLCSVGVFVCQSTTISFIAASVSEGRSLANGLYYLGYYSGGAVSTLLAGLAYEGWGWPGAVMTICAMQVLGGLIAWTTWRKA